MGNENEDKKDEEFLNQYLNRISLKKMYTIRLDNKWFSLWDSVCNLW